MILLLASGAGSTSLQAQVLYGAVVGSVQDPSGAVVPNVQITVTNSETGQSRESSSDGSGNYTISNLLPGVYTVKATGPGFRTVTRTGLDVQANSTARVDLSMEVGQVSEVVNVDASAAQLQTDRSDTSTTLTTRPVATLPLNVYRNYQALINLVPGATPAAFQNSSTDTPGRSLSTSVNGTPRNMNTTRLDGAVNVNIWLPHHNAYVAPSETVQEVNVSTTALDAEQGSAGGAAVTVITKSGTNDLHGSAWEYHNNQHMKSRPYFLPTAQDKPRDTLNIFGGTLGGPVLKNKLFYFGNFEGTRQRVGGSGIFNVPTARVRNGDFSGLSPIYDPQTGNPDGSGRTQFPNNRVPDNRINPITKRILGLLPLPNNGSAETQNFRSGGTGIFDRNNYDYKINYSRNDRHQIWGKSSYLVADVTGVPIFGEIVGPPVVQDPGTGHTFTQVYTVGHSISLKPNLLLDQNFGIIRNKQDVKGLDYGTNWGSEVFGIPGTNGPDIRQSGMPNFDFGYATVGLAATWMPLFRTEQSYTHDTNLSWIRRKHDFRFGYNLVHHQLNHWQPEIANPRGNFTFGANITSTPGQTSNLYNQMAAFLLGMPSEISKSLQYEEMSGREWQHGVYFRDRWQVSRKLTLNLGIRMDYYPLMTRQNTGLELYDPATNIVTFTGRGNVPTNQGLSINNPLWAPRVGIAYRLSEKTVLRTGYGLTWDPLPFSRPLRGWYPLTVSSTSVGPNGFTPAGSLSTGIPDFTGPDLSKGSGLLPATADHRSPWGAINRGYIQSWNFTVERELPTGIVASAAYVGTQVTNQFADRNINVGLPGTQTTDLPLARAFGRRIALNMWDGWLSSNYHSLQVAFSRQTAAGLFLKGAYTWSKAINMTDDNGWTSVNWNSPEVISRNRARAGYDRRHNLQLAYGYELPFGRGRKWLNSGPASWIVGNWGINGLFYAFTGAPLGNILSSVACNCPGNLQTANQLKTEVNKPGQHGPGTFYYDPTAFGDPTPNTFGNSGRNVISGPGRIGTDVSLARIFPIGERFRFELRGDAFNLTNTPQFSDLAAGNRTVGNPNFMQVLAASGERQLRVGGVIRF